METEKIVRTLKSQGNKDGIKRIIALLAQDFVCGLNSNNKKGGLIGLASCAIALMRDMDDHLDVVIPSVLKGFGDAESRVRYYACESLFNIAKVCRGAVVPFFNDVFTGLCKLVADVDQDCRNGAGLLDRLLKEVVLEAPAPELQMHITAFVPLLKAHMMSSANPYVRQTLIGWVVALDSVPGVSLLIHVHELLGGLFGMLSDGNREVRSAAYMALAGFLDQLDKQATEEARWASSCKFHLLVEVVMSYTHKERDMYARLTAVEWLGHILAQAHMRAELAPLFSNLAGTLLKCMSDGGPGSSGDAELIGLAFLATSDLQDLVMHTPAEQYDAAGLVRTVTSDVFLCHPDRLTRSCALRWTGQLLVQCPNAVLARVEGSTVYAQGQPSSSLSSLGSAASGTPAGAGAADTAVASKAAVDSTSGRALLDCLLRNLLDGIVEGNNGATGTGSSTSGSAAAGAGVSGTGVSAVSDTDVLKLTLEVLARLAVTDASLLRSKVLTELVRLFGSHRGLLEGRAAFIVRRLCLLLEPSVVYISLSAILATEPNREFASLMVELLNLLLLTAVELADFRDSLRGCAAGYTKASTTSAVAASQPLGRLSTALGVPASPTGVFLSLYETWVQNPIAALALCLLTQAYELADRIVLALGEVAVTLGLLMQVDKLVQLIESPVFLHTRMHLLQPELGGGQRRSQAYLLRALYGLLMLLPQGTAYNTLKDRLQAVTNLHIATGGVLGSIESASSAVAVAAPLAPGSTPGTDSIDSNALFAVFAQSQAAARANLSADLRARSLLRPDAPGIMAAAGRAGSSIAFSGQEVGSGSSALDVSSTFGSPGRAGTAQASKIGASGMAKSLLSAPSKEQSSPSPPAVGVTGLGETSGLTTFASRPRADSGGT